MRKQPKFEEFVIEEFVIIVIGFCGSGYRMRLESFSREGYQYHVQKLRFSILE